MKIVFIGIWLFSLSCTLKVPSCNQGKPILTRTWKQPYELQYQCLCPFDYFGKQCQEHRQISCLSKNPQVLKYNPEQTNNATLTFQIQCFLPKIKDPNQKGLDSYANLPLSALEIQSQYNDSNYYIDPDYQIIWSNDTDMFDRQGNLIEKENGTSPDQEALGEHDPYEFEYSEMFGIPLFKSTFEYSVYSVRFTNYSFWIEKVQPEVEPITKQNKTVAFLLIFETTLSPEMEQFGVTRLQLEMNEVYGNTGLKSHVMMNNAKWRLNNPAFPKSGAYLTGSSSLSSSFWMILITVSVIILIICVRYLMNFYKNWKKKRIRKELEEQGEDIAKES